VTLDSDSANRPAPLFLEPVYLHRVWGGTRLHDLLGGELPSDTIGECLAISAHPEGDCLVRDGEFAGTPLSRLWTEHPDLFGVEATGGQFPLQVKILDASADLSIQVHPTAQYAVTHDNDAEKNECWFVLGASESGKILVGHNAETREQFAQMATEGRWDELLRHIDMAEGDFFFIPAGTVHAILAGSLIYEVQQASNATYRLYDYDRLDNGVKRELHVAKALDVVAAPSRPCATRPMIALSDGATRYLYTRNEHFTFSRWIVDGDALVPMDSPFLLAGVLEGSGEVNGVGVALGDHFIVPAGSDSALVSGRMTLMVSGL
jgi:mannose-6-phosphate isomerase